MAIARSLKEALTTPYEGFTNFFEYQKQDFIKCQNILLETLRNSSIPFDPIPA